LIKIQKSLFWHVNKNADETAVSVILARPKYLQQFFFCIFGHPNKSGTQNILLIGSYGVGFTKTVFDPEENKEKSL
jgi:hypothetical protein